MRCTLDSFARLWEHHYGVARMRPFPVPECSISFAGCWPASLRFGYCVSIDHRVPLYEAAVAVFYILNAKLRGITRSFTISRAGRTLYANLFAGTDGAVVEQESPPLQKVIQHSCFTTFAPLAHMSLSGRLAAPSSGAHPALVCTSKWVSGGEVLRPLTVSNVSH
jgi:hypothetical protein